MPPKTFSKLTWLYLSLGILAALLIYRWIVPPVDGRVLPYSEFLQNLEAGKIAEVTVGKEEIRGTFKQLAFGQGKGFVTVRIEDTELPRRLTEKGISFQGERHSALSELVLFWILPVILFYFFWRWMMTRAGLGPRGEFQTLGRSKAKVYVEKGLKTSFDDVAGVDEAKEELKEVVQFLKEPGKFSRLGGRIPKGILLVGPPGTGKTLLARAVAGEANVPFFSINGSEFVELFVGLGAARVRDLFEQARKNAPCIIFIDELDALGKSRILHPLGSGHEETEQTLNQLLAELDGFDPAESVILLAATNRPEVLDPALLRAGRFDRQILLDKPDRAGRVEILKVHVKNMKLHGSVRLEEIAGLTPGFSGADLANLVNEAALTAARRGSEAIYLEDFTQALERIVAGLERKNRLMNPEEKRRVAHHEMGHATAALALKTGEKVHKVSIIPRGIGSLGYTLQRPIEDRYLMSRRELLEKMVVLMSGRASEAIFFSDISTGAADDFGKASDIARAMVTQFGMSEKLGMVAYEKEISPLLKGEYEPRRTHFSESTAEKIDAEVKSLVDEAYSLAIQTLQEHRAFLEECANLLLEKETLTGMEIEAFWSEHEMRLNSRKAKP